VSGLVVSCPCGEVYELRTEYAGRLLECPAFGRHLRAGQAPGLPRPPAPGTDPAFARDRFLLRERMLTITSKYEVWAEDGTPILYVERPTYPVRTVLAYVLAALAALIVMGLTARLASMAPEPTGPLLAIVGWAAVATTFLVVSMSLRPLRHVTVYRDESRREILLRVLQDQRLAVLTRTYTVVSTVGETLARFRKRYLYNILRKRWDILTPAGALIAQAIEDSVILSLLRRVLGPLFGVLRTNFLLVTPDGEVVGEFNRKFTLLDRYVLDFTGDPGRAIDRRVGLALGVMLDTGERR
jgi:uncharacterized protein YxjI